MRKDEVKVTVFEDPLPMQGHGVQELIDKIFGKKIAKYLCISQKMSTFTR